MFRQDFDISLGQYRFPFAVEVEAESSWENFTDTCELTLPRKLEFQGRTIAEGESLFRRGDAVNVRLGYDGNYDDVFSGYVANIMPGVPIKFECEDAAWLLKQSPVDASYRNATLQQILTDISPIPFQAVTAELGPFRITDVTPAEVLKELHKEYNLRSWCRDGVLYVGLAYWTGESTEHVFRFTSNIIDSDLTYVKQADVRRKVKAISILRDNTKLEVELGDSDGELRTYTYYNVESEAELRRIAERELAEIRIEGYEGSFTSFGQPAVRHGDIVNIQDPDHPDRNGRYLVKKVVTMGGNNGYRQKIFPDRKL